MVRSATPLGLGLAVALLFTACSSPPAASVAPTAGSAAPPATTAAVPTQPAASVASTQPPAAPPTVAAAPTTAEEPTVAAPPTDALPPTSAPVAASEGELDSQAQRQTYTQLVYLSYKDAYDRGLALQSAIDAFLEDPSDSTLDAAKQAWLASREPYGQTEPYRFYGGPIDVVDEATGLEGPEGRLNAWPLNEAHIDYVEGNPDAGIIADTSVEITEAAIIERNSVDDEAAVSTGYHAIEFLLWGQDVSDDGPGARPADDYLPGDPIRERRGQYLRVVTALLVNDLKGLADAWEPGQADNYAAQFLQLDERQALGHMLTGIGSLSGFELSSERIAVSLDSGDQEDEHSCFSDNTHNDFRYNARGIRNIYLGEYGAFKGAGINALAARVAPDINAQLEAQLATTEQLADAVTPPIDLILGSPTGSPQRTQMQDLSDSFRVQANLIKELGDRLGVEVIITGE